jgi:pimeloyl-ACP methyl ester carboxylesterase
MGKHTLFKGKRIHYTLHGKGRAIVLIHGFLESVEIWKLFARKLSSNYAVVCIDLPGHGRSESVGPVHTMELMADIVNHVLKENSISSCLVTGHSMGGYVALAFTERYHRKVKGICLFHSHAGSDTPETRQNRERTIKLVEKNKKNFIQAFIPDLFDHRNLAKYQDEIRQLRLSASATSKEAIIAALEGMKVRMDRTHILANTHVPVQFIIGKNDSRIPMQMIMPQTVLPRHSEALILDGIGHMGFIEAGRETYLSLHGFAKKVLS